MIVIKGIAASPGIAIGRAYLLEDMDWPVERINLPAELLRAETHRFKTALKATLKDLDQSEAKILKVLGRQHARLIAAHRLILKDPSITSQVPQRILKDGMNAEFALHAVLEELSRHFERMPDEFFRERRHDLWDVGKRILFHLLKKAGHDHSAIAEKSIVISRNLLPSDTMALPRTRVLGFCTDLGGKTSHTALMAQSLNLPAVVGLSDASRRIKTGDAVILDGQEGLLIAQPTPETLAKYEKTRLDLAQEETALDSLKGLPAQTLDGRSVKLDATLDSPDDLGILTALSPDGIGLFRTECLFINSPIPPREEDQVAVYSSVLAALSPKSVTIRTADLGADRISRWGMAAPSAEPNPAMGLRGMRLSLRHPAILKAQIRAILRARSAGPVRIMFPMIATLNEMLQAKQMLVKAASELEAEGFGATKAAPIQWGIMIEVPSAALTVEAFLPSMDFISVGTNDLIQYTLACDRLNENVSDFYDPFHPAVLRLLAKISETARRLGKDASVCGEMTADPHAVPLLVGLGFESLSVPARMYLRIKKIVRSLRHASLERLAKKALDAEDSEGVRRLLAEEGFL